MDKTPVKFTGKKRILKASRHTITPLKKLLNLPSRLKNKIVGKSGSFWKYPLRKGRKRKFDVGNENKENENASVAKKYQHQTQELSKYKKMAVIHTDYPTSLLSPDQGNLIKKYIKDGLANVPSSWRSILDIKNIQYAEGISYITCGNQRTVNWLWENVHVLGDSEDEVLLRVVELKFLPHKEQQLHASFDRFDIDA